MSRSWRLSNPYESPSQTDGKSRSRLLSADNPKYLWLFGYLSQIVLFALFIAAMLADFSITELESRDVVFVIFNCLVAVFALTSTFAILIMMNRTIGIRLRRSTAGPWFDSIKIKFWVKGTAGTVVPSPRTGGGAFRRPEPCLFVWNATVCLNQYYFGHHFWRGCQA